MSLPPPPASGPDAARSPASAAGDPTSPEAIDAVAAPAAVQRARSLNLVLLTALLLLCLLWELWLARTGSGTLALKALPLLPCLPGLWRHRLYTYRWLSLLVWLYVTEGLVRATSESGPAQVLAALEVAIATALFIGCVHYIRLRLPRRPKAGAAAPASASPSSSEPASPAP